MLIGAFMDVVPQRNLPPICGRRPADWKTGRRRLETGGHVTEPPTWAPLRRQAEHHEKFLAAGGFSAATTAEIVEIDAHHSNFAFIRLRSVALLH